ncbi:hypothetical protein [Amycolatopsis pigmentata]|uniref:Uncharacterized protein n=1 Tax=Amycolatopsis pigmentata TaxID=450801 RepID=A0ABW5G9Q5_9PSEU
MTARLALSPTLIADLRARDPEYQAAQNNNDTQGERCADCGRPPSDSGVRALARGLCRTCHAYHRNKGTLDERYPRTYRRDLDTIENYQKLSTRGLSRAEIAERLGLTYGGLTSALRRAGLTQPKKARRRGLLGGSQ